MMLLDGLPVRSDSPFQRQLRSRQSQWREEQGLPIGEHNGRPLGSRLAMPFARDELANYLTPTIREVVSGEVLGASRDRWKLYSEPRIFNDLLSSQPLCFNLFGELKADLEAATAFARQVWPDRVDRVTGVEFEWSPGRGNATYLDNRSAFDVVLFTTAPSGGRGFIGIEVKYHENLKVKAAEHKSRYDEVAASSGVFDADVVHLLRTPPLQQVWLDHLLALSMLQADPSYDDGLFVFLYPRDNVPCALVSSGYKEHLVDTETFQQLTLEDAVQAIRESTGASWIDLFEQRYLTGPA
jgi:hypothetical protein